MMMLNPRAFDIGDPVRPFIGHAVIRTLVAAVVFVFFAYGTKEIKPLYVHTPWMDDPYDAVVSSTAFFVPLVVGLALLRIPLCRRDQPLPIPRAMDLLRSSHLVLWAAAITLMADWVSVATRANQASWNGSSKLAIGLLSLTSLVVAKAGMDLRRASSKLRQVNRVDTESDWLDDAVLLTLAAARRLGAWTDTGIRCGRWVEQHALPFIRRHPLLTAASAAAGFGTATTGSQGVGEGIGPRPVLLLYFGVAASAMYAFLAVGGAYLGLVRSERQAQGTQRRLIDAVVASCAAVPIAVAFRSSWLGLVGTSGHGAGRLLAALLVVALCVFALTFLVESLAGIHEASPASDQ
jgi:hypothetical protein